MVCHSLARLPPLAHSSQSPENPQKEGLPRAREPIAAAPPEQRNPGDPKAGRARHSTVAQAQLSPLRQALPMLRAPLSNLDLANALGWMTFATLAGGAAFGTFTWWWSIERPRRLDLRRQLELMSGNQRSAKRQIEQLESDLERAQEELSEQRERTTRAKDMSSGLGSLSRAVDVLQQAGPAPELLDGLARVSALLERHDTEQATHFKTLEGTLDARLGEQFERLNSEFERLGSDLANLAENARGAAETDALPVDDNQDRAELEAPAPEFERALLAEHRVAALAAEKRELEGSMRQRLESITANLALVDRAQQQAAPRPEVLSEPPSAPVEALALEPTLPPPAPEQEPESIKPLLEAPASALPTQRPGRRPGQLLALMDALEAESDLQARASLLRRLQTGIADARSALRP